MPDPTSNSLTPLLSALGGYLIAAVTQYFRDRRAHAREREARAEERQLKLFERRSDFQRETLLTLQEAIQRLARTAGQMQHHDEMTFRSTGQWGRSLYGEEISTANFNAGVQTLIFTSRVRDEKIRELAKTFRTLVMRMVFCKSHDESVAIMTEAMAVQEPLQGRIGMILRQLDDEDTLELERSR